MKTPLYLLVAQGHAKTAEVATKAETEFKKERPQNNLSITPNVAGTQAIVKTFGDAAGFLELAIQDKWTADEHQAKLDEIKFYSEDWQPKEELSDEVIK